MTARAGPLTVLWSKQRMEALTDGIFAVAMTLLVIELKLPDPHAIHGEEELIAALAALTPKAISWVISFFVLAVFWISHHRLYHYVRHVDAGLLWRNLIQLALVSLMPFSAGLIGEFGAAVISQIAYNVNMVMLGLAALWQLGYIRRHPELTSHPIEVGTYHGMLLRTGGLVACGIAAIVIRQVNGTPYATLVYLLMMPVARYTRRLESTARAAAAAARGGPTPPEHP